MSGSGGSTTKDEKIDKDPWAPAQPYLKDIMAEGSRLYKDGVGSETWGGPLQGALDDNLRLGIKTTQDMARDAINGQSLTAQPAGVLGQIAEGTRGITTGGGFAGMAGGPAISTGGQFAGLQPGISTAGGFAGLAGDAGGATAADRYLAGMASGADAGKNPHLQAMLDANAARIGNRVNSAMSGAGRYGSASHGDALARSINETNLPLLAQAYEADKGRQLQATGMIDNSRMGARGQQLAALTGQTGAESQIFDNRMRALQGQTGVEGANYDARLRALQGQTGVESQNLANQGQAATGLLNFAPMMNNLRYDAGNRLMGIGGMLTDRNQDLIDRQRGLFEQQQSRPWEMLQRMQGSINMPLLQGMGTTTGHSTGTYKPPSNPWQTIGGLGLAGLGLMGGFPGSGMLGGMFGGGMGMPGSGTNASLFGNPNIPSAGFGPSGMPFGASYGYG